jgi:hypothetical protein
MRNLPSQHNLALYFLRVPGAGGLVRCEFRTRHASCICPHHPGAAAQLGAAAPAERQMSQEIGMNAPTMGLCCTCNNSPSCFHHARRGPALYCEMFDNYVELPAGGNGDPHHNPGVFRTASEDRSRHLGLCMNCEHRRSCAHPQPSGGVWHCEDYE